MLQGTTFFSLRGVDKGNCPQKTASCQHYVHQAMRKIENKHCKGKHERLLTTIIDNNRHFQIVCTGTLSKAVFFSVPGILTQGCFNLYRGPIKMAADVSEAVRSILVSSTSTKVHKAEQNNDWPNNLSDVTDSFRGRLIRCCVIWKTISKSSWSEGICDVT